MNAPAAYLELYKRSGERMDRKVNCLVQDKMTTTQSMLCIAQKALTRAHEMLERGNMPVFRAEIDLCFDACNSILEDCEQQEENSVAEAITDDEVPPME